MTHNIRPDFIVRVGKGTVDYTVESVEGDSVKIRGGKGNRVQTVEASRLKVVKVGSATVPEFYNEEVSSPVVEELSLSTHNEVAKSLGEGIFVLFDDNEPVEYKSFDAAAFIVSRNHVSRFVSIVRDGAVTVQRKRAA
jgi:hypothetical protein